MRLLEISQLLCFHFILLLTFQQLGNTKENEVQLSTFLMARIQYVKPVNEPKWILYQEYILYRFTLFVFSLVREKVSSKSKLSDRQLWKQEADEMLDWSWGRYCLVCLLPRDRHCFRIDKHTLISRADANLESSYQAQSMNSIPRCCLFPLQGSTVFPWWILDEIDSLVNNLGRRNVSDKMGTRREEF
jgi:hypothetical protein